MWYINYSSSCPEKSLPKAGGLRGPPPLGHGAAAAAAAVERAAETKGGATVGFTIPMTDPYGAGRFTYIETPSQSPVVM